MELSIPIPMIIVPTIAVKIFRFVPPASTVAGYHRITNKIGKKVITPNLTELKITIIVINTKSKLSLIVSN